MPLINAAHTIIYSRDPEAARAFFRDILKLPFADAGDGWLIFALPPAEVAFHPADSAENDGRHQLYFMCKDIEATVADLKSKGVDFTSGITNERWGRVTTMKIPGGGELSIYEPRHASPLNL